MELSRKVKIDGKPAIQNAAVRETDRRVARTRRKG